jgi:hypothetical protein
LISSEKRLCYGGEITSRMGSCFPGAQRARRGAVGTTIRGEGRWVDAVRVLSPRPPRFCGEVFVMAGFCSEGEGCLTRLELNSFFPATVICYVHSIPIRHQPLEKEKNYTIFGL